MSPEAVSAVELLRQFCVGDRVVRLPDRVGDNAGSIPAGTLGCVLSEGRDGYVAVRWNTAPVLVRYYHPETVRVRLALVPNDEDRA